MCSLGLVQARIFHALKVHALSFKAIIRATLQLLQPSVLPRGGELYLIDLPVIGLRDAFGPALGRSDLFVDLTQLDYQTWDLIELGGPVFYLSEMKAVPSHLLGLPPLLGLLGSLPCNYGLGLEAPQGVILCVHFLQSCSLQRFECRLSNRQCCGANIKQQRDLLPLVAQLGLPA